MRTLATVIFFLLFGAASASADGFETVIEIDVDEVESFLEETEVNLGVELRSAEIAEVSESIKDGNVFQKAFDMSYGGITFEAVYQVARVDSGRVSVSFSALQRRAIEAICRSFKEAEEERKDVEGEKSCNLATPETFRV